MEKCVDKKKKKKKLASDVRCKSAALLKQLEVNSFTLSEFKKKKKKRELQQSPSVYNVSLRRNVYGCGHKSLDIQYNRQRRTYVPIKSLLFLLHCAPTRRAWRYLS